jgi:16S rRNA (cytidine1402-2'-O)-methyltransferase
MLGTLFVVATPIGNLEDITLRALRVLREVSVVAAEDTRRSGILLRHYDIRTPLVSFHDHNEHSRTPGLLSRLRAGESVALVSDAGTPLVSDPGFGLVRQALEAGIRVEAVPGPSAVTAALSVSGLPVNGFTFAGFPPARASERERWLAARRDVQGTQVFFEVPHRIRATLEAMLEQMGDRWTVLARELTKVHETTRRGWISDLVAGGAEERGEYVILVSDLMKSVDNTDPTRVADAEPAGMAERFGVLTKHGGLSNRDAVAQLADETGLSRQNVYARLRSAGILG